MMLGPLKPVGNGAGTRQVRRAFEIRAAPMKHFPRLPIDAAMEDFTPRDFEPVRWKKWLALTCLALGISVIAGSATYGVMHNWNEVRLNQSP